METIKNNIQTYIYIYQLEIVYYVKSSEQEDWDKLLLPVIVFHEAFPSQQKIHQL